MCFSRRVRAVLLLSLHSLYFLSFPPLRRCFYVFGGYNGVERLNDLYEFNLQDSMYAVVSAPAHLPAPHYLFPPLVAVGTAASLQSEPRAMMQRAGILCTHPVGEARWWLRCAPVAMRVGICPQRCRVSGVQAFPLHIWWLQWSNRPG